MNKCCMLMSGLNKNGGACGQVMQVVGAERENMAHKVGCLHAR